jgi:hypothetical protein
MRLMLHIFRKDVRRLWWAIGLTVILLATLARQDGWRSDAVPGPIEGWLNILLPLAWTVLVALVIQEEPLVGDRQFWITRPYRRPVLFAAKAVFLLLFIHAASFLADYSILAARGFAPLEFVPERLWKQFVLAVALTLPAAALAAIVRSLAHFLVLAIALASAAVYLQGTLGPMVMPFVPPDLVRRGIALLILAAAAACILTLQYARRKTFAARTAGIAAMTAAILLFAYVPRRSTAAVQTKLAPLSGINVSLRIVEMPSYEARGPVFGTRVEIAPPIEITGLPPDAFATLEQLSLEINAPGEAPIHAAPVSPYIRYDKARPVEATLSGTSGTFFLRLRNPAWQRITLDRSLYDRLKSTPVDLRGEAAAVVYRLLPAVPLPVEGRRWIGGLGWCTSKIGEDRWTVSRLKVVCESPRPIAPQTPVELRWPGGGETIGRLGDSMTAMGYPTSTWLSPLYRSETSFRIADQPQLPRERLLIPRSVLPSAQLSVRPEQLVGRTVFHYDLRQLRLSEFEVKPPR